MGKTASSLFSAVFDRILFIVACKDDIREYFDEFEIWPDSNTYYGASCTSALEKNLHILIMGKTVSPRFLGCF